MNEELEKVIKRLKKDLNECKNDTATLVFTEDLEIALNYIDNSISKEVIEEKIKYKKNKLKQIRNDRYREMCLQIEIDILQELLEGK